MALSCTTLLFYIYSVISLIFTTCGNIFIRFFNSKLKPYTIIDAALDAAILHKAFIGIVTYNDALINVLAPKNKQQIQLIDREFRIQSENGAGLVQEFEKSLSGYYLQLLVGVVTPVIEFKKLVLLNAAEGREALVDTMEGYGKNDALIDVLCHSTNSDIRLIAKDTVLVKKILDSISGDFKQVIEILLSGNRPGGIIPIKDAQDLAQEFYEAGEGKYGTDENKYTTIITGHSLIALQMVDEIYKRKYKNGLIEAVEKETSGYYKSALVALLQSDDEFYVSRLHYAMSGMIETDERTIVYVFSILERSDLKRIAGLYNLKYQETLQKAIERATTGNFCKFLVALLVDL